MTAGGPVPHTLTLIQVILQFPPQTKTQSPGCDGNGTEWMASKDDDSMVMFVASFRVPGICVVIG